MIKESFCFSYVYTYATVGRNIGLFQYVDNHKRHTSFVNIILLSMKVHAFHMLHMPLRSLKNWEKRFSLWQKAEKNISPRRLGNSTLQYMGNVYTRCIRTQGFSLMNDLVLSLWTMNWKVIHFYWRIFYRSTTSLIQHFKWFL